VTEPAGKVLAVAPSPTTYTCRSCGWRCASRIGGEYRVEWIGGRCWRRFATENGLDPAATVARIDELAARTPASLAKAAQTAQARALESDLPTRLIERVTARVSQCREALAR
jgi:serine/threonine-protein kinase HipA